MKIYMSLSCKAGAYNKVLKRLLDLNIPRKDIFVLFGPVDLLIRFDKLKNLNAFIEEQFDLVRKIGAEERLITKTLTFIVISEGPAFTENPFAFIFLNVQPQNLENVRVMLLNIPEILSADTVFGPYDIICSVKAKDRKDLEQVILNIQTHIRGIEESMTAIVATRNTWLN